MKKKIAFIDLYLDEWHANNYPGWLANAPRADEFELAFAWEKRARQGGRGLEQWCADMNVMPVTTLREAVDRADCIMVLAPSNPEAHEELADYALTCGKPLYIDKPFAPTKAAAQRLFAKAETYGTPLMSSSALRFGDELIHSELPTVRPMMLTTTGGGGSFHEYAIHQLEMIVSIMGTEIEKVIATGGRDNAAVVLEYSGGRLASMAYSKNYPFSITASMDEKYFVYPLVKHSFDNLLAAILDFFATGKSCVPKEQTIAIAELLEKTVRIIEP